MFALCVRQQAAAHTIFYQRNSDELLFVRHGCTRHLVLENCLPKQGVTQVVGKRYANSTVGAV